MKYNSLHIATFSMIMIFFNACGMNPLLELKEYPIKEGYLETLDQLKEDLNNNKLIYKFGYFEPISKQINKLTELHKKNPTNTTFLFLLKEYKEQLNSHANKGIQWIINNPIYPTSEVKLAILKSYFPESDPILKEYFDLGQQSIQKKQKVKQIPQQISRQLIVAHSEEKKEKELLENIIKYHPHENPKIDFSIYTPLYFRGLSGTVEIIKKVKQDPTIYINKLNEEAITYINYVATNEQWPTIESKLAQIKTCLPDQTLFYLEITLQHNQPTMIISIIPEEEPIQEPGTVEEVPSEEETLEPESVISTYEQQPSPTVVETPKTIKTEVSREPKPQANMFTRAISFVWNGITTFMSNIYYGLKWIITKLAGSDKF